ncbi:Receptor like protein 33 [Theobroma cacao]|uniref:Receptor like protein 33 n=1 Tax=Theobroma cacao TaxID=3641 RepID=A0A061FJB3_THECC|nr:Receptor like protein 33 [Theobroma cacao]
MIDIRPTLMGNIKFHFLWMLLIQCFIIGFTRRMIVSNLNTDQFTLLEFKNQILNHQDVLASNWSSTSSVCHWVGISCSASHGRVSVVDLSNMGLKGTIAPHLGNLSFLVSLHLSGNNFHGYLPKELAKLRHLKLIDLSYNIFNGGIPLWFGASHKVKYLVLSNNNFTGTIPPTLADMSNLETLDLRDNLIQGKIPMRLAIFKSQRCFVYHSTHFLAPYLQASLICPHRNRFLYHIINYQETSRIILDYNSLEAQTSYIYSKPMPPVPLKLSPRGFLQSEIPSEIGNLNRFEIFAASEMHLSGLVPPSILNISSLKEIYLHNNSLSGNLLNNFNCIS